MPHPRIFVISDSPKIHTGFASVVRPVVGHLHNTGKYTISQLGLMDSQPDFDGVVPWDFIPTLALDDLAHQSYGPFIRARKPDVVLIIQPASNAARYRGIKEKSCEVNGKNPKIVLYTPIEGDPITRDTIEGLQLADKVVAYSNYARDVIKEQAGVDSTVAFHGGDHEAWLKYSSPLRKKIRQYVNFDDKFVVGYMGVNKRTKGVVEALQVAKILKERGRTDIMFYIHTNPDKQTMLGYDLRSLSEYYGVDDMIQWRIVFDDMSYWIGHPAINDTMERMMVEERDIPKTDQQRGLLFASFDLRTIFNTFDLFLDLSQVEGWGLPLHEAMMCGVPSLTIDDQAVRSEIWQNGPAMISPIPKRCWHSLHTGAKLATIDPVNVADMVEFYADCDGARQELSNLCLAAARRYKWLDCSKTIEAAIDEVVQVY